MEFDIFPVQGKFSKEKCLKSPFNQESRPMEEASIEDKIH